MEIELTMPTLKDISPLQRTLLKRMNEQELCIENTAGTTNRGKALRQVYNLCDSNRNIIEDITAQSSTINSLLKNGLLVSAEEEGKVVYFINKKRQTLVDALE